MYQWTLTMNDAGPSPLRVIAVSHHNDQAGCAATETRPGPLFRMTGTTEFAPHSAGQTILSYDTRDKKCGRVQVDASLLDSDGRLNTLIVGEVINYVADCTSEPPSTPPARPGPPASPTPPAAPTPTPAQPSTMPMCPDVDVIADARFIKAGDSVTASFFVKPGVENAIISLATYRRDTPAFLPQSMLAPPVSGVFSSGGPYTLSRPVSSCRAQVDLIRCVAANEPLTAGNYSDLNNRTMAFWYDNTECP